METYNLKYLSVLAIVIGLLVTIQPIAVYGSFSGHNTKGDLGLQSGSQPAPGFYAIAPMYYRYDADTLRDSSGNAISPDPSDRGSLTANAYIFGLIWVSEYQIFGGNYSFQIYPAFTDNALEAPLFGLNDGVSTGLADLYFQPINLGWHTERADFTAGIGIYAPTGEYEIGGSDNRGLGMWTFEVFAGSTVYLDDAKSWHIATTAFYETHTDKDGSDVIVGDILTLEGGLGKSFMEGAIIFGASYYAQWKITEDTFGPDDRTFSDRSDGKHRVYGVGPELTLPIASSNKLYGVLNARYFWEFGSESIFEGETFVLTLTLPIPSIPL